MHYNVHYVMFIVPYIMLKLHFDIKLWHIFHKCQNNVKLKFLHNTWHNKHHIMYIVMNEPKFLSHTCVVKLLKYLV